MEPSKKKLKKFILDTLLPYKKDPSKCAILNDKCVYIMRDGKTTKKCALGKWMKKGPWQSEHNKSAHCILIDHHAPRS